MIMQRSKLLVIIGMLTFLVGGGLFEGVSNLLICYSICEAKIFHMMEGYDDHPGVALPLVPRDRHRPAWYVS